MARGVKRSTRDILTEQLNKAQERLDKAIAAKEAAEVEIKDIQQKLEDLKFEELKELIEERNITVDELKDLLANR